MTNKKKLLPALLLAVIALSAGFGLAFLAAGIHSLFFILLPIIAFALGYFSSWRWGLLSGFLLFASYTCVISLIWHGFSNPDLLYPVPYIGSFIFGGFGVLLVGALAPMVKKGIKKVGSITALIILAVMIGWCGYSATPHYSYYYQVIIQSSENLDNLELYLPLGTVSSEPYEELYDQVFEIPGHLGSILTDNFTQELVDTEQGKMLKMTIPELKKDDVPDPRYTANIIFCQKNAPRKLLQLMPKSNVQQVNSVTWQSRVGPVKSHESLITERYNVPVKIVSSTQGQIKLTLWSRTDRSEAVNFAYSRSYPYTELINFDIATGNEWVFIPVEATIVTDIRGISD